MTKKKVKSIVSVIVFIIVAISAVVGYFLISKNGDNGNENPGFIGTTNIPQYSESLFIQLNDNVPVFSDDEKTTTGYENYSELDSLGRCGVAVASLGLDTMPAPDEERGSISSVYPSGWKYDGVSNNNKYDTSLVSGGYIYNRSHMIGWQLSAENANDRNLITGTRYFNTPGMLDFENMVADYIKETGNHVAYRVTPVYVGNNLVCHGVQIEAYSVEDNGDGISFNVFIYNVQPGIVIDYATGDNWLATEASENQAQSNVLDGYGAIVVFNQNKKSTNFVDFSVF